MKEIICYQLEDGSVYADKEEAIEAEKILNNKTVLDYTQQVPLNFSENSIVYIANRDKVRKCKVIFIDQSFYDENTEELYTFVDLEDINENESLFRYCTTSVLRDLNIKIKTNPLELFNFKYESNL